MPWQSSRDVGHTKKQMECILYETNFEMSVNKSVQNIASVLKLFEQTSYSLLYVILWAKNA